MVLVKPQKFSYNCQVCCHNLFISIFHSFFLQHPFSRTLLYESFFRLLTMFLFFKTFISSLVNIFLTWGDFSLFANRKSSSQRTKLIHTPQTKKNYAYIIFRKFCLTIHIAKLASYFQDLFLSCLTISINVCKSTTTNILLSYIYIYIFVGWTWTATRIRLIS